MIHDPTPRYIRSIHGSMMARLKWTHGSVLSLPPLKTIDIDTKNRFPSQSLRHALPQSWNTDASEIAVIGQLYSIQFNFCKANKIPWEQCKPTDEGFLAHRYTREYILPNILGSASSACSHGCKCPCDVKYRYSKVFPVSCIWRCNWFESVIATNCPEHGHDALQLRHKESSSRHTLIMMGPSSESVDRRSNEDLGAQVHPRGRIRNFLPL